MLLRTVICTAMIISGCNGPAISQPNHLTDTRGNTIQTRFDAPAGYKRVQGDSFTQYLRSLPLLEHGATLSLYNKKPKGRQDVHAAIIKMDIGHRDLQQCADAVMRLRAEYLYHAGKYDDIHFNFTSGFRADYSKWRQGYRIAVKVSNATWVKTAQAGTGYNSFRQYLDMVFSYAGTLSLSKELMTVPFKNMLPGDVLIQGGAPGHAVIVMDVAMNSSGNKVFLLAQSYMPAQDVHVLNNFNNKKMTPWYSMEDVKGLIETPEWDFTTADLKRF